MTSYDEKRLSYGFNLICPGQDHDDTVLEKLTFGKSKGLTFDRVLIIPTASYRKYLMGSEDVFKSNKTEEAKNKLYVAITRARFSVTFVIPPSEIDNCSIPLWNSC